jgi:short-subunit dehydrogenase
MSKVLIIGATSAIAQATARLMAARGDALILVGRSEEKLKAVADDLLVRGAERVDFTAMDASETGKHEPLIGTVYEMLGGLDTVLIAHGVLPDQEACQEDFEEAARSLNTNFMSVVSYLTPIANRLEEQKHGCIAVISSVAGDRGRQSNYVYGTAKAAVSTFLSGLRNRLSKSGVAVVDIRPGFVDTPMTAEFEKKGLLWAQPEAIARGIVKAIDKKKDIVYLPFFWRWIMLIIRCIPERIFKKLGL